MTFTPPSYGAVKFPDWGVALGWSMAVFILLWIPVIALYKLMRAEGSPWKVCMLWFKNIEVYFHLFKEVKIVLENLIFYFPQRLKSLCSPSEEWHPYLDIHRGERYSAEHCRHRMTSKHTPEVNVNVITSSWL